KRIHLFLINCHNSLICSQLVSICVTGI
ncbi:unnamed protein product, partial [Allacma fusca]